MGGSLSMALRHFVPGATVLGVDRDPGRLDEARALNVADEFAEDASQLDPSEFEVVFLATPVSTIAPLVRQLASQASGGALLTDLGSVKQTIYADVAGNLPPGVEFIGGHPMTGSQLEGLEGADPHLYENAVYILTPDRGTDPDALAALRSILEGLGCLVQTMTPKVHDEAVSTISHLPYLLACSMVEVLQEKHGQDGGRAAPIAAGSFQGATRVASCPPHIFRDILQSNRVALRSDVERLMKSMQSYLDVLDEEGGRELQERFREAQQFRRRLPGLRKGVLPNLPEAIIKAQDQPGFIGQVASLIGAAHINIRDIEVLHSREGEGGTLRVAFETQEDRRKALRILEIADYIAEERDP
jgi:prephenate dehydrogenase